METEQYDEAVRDYEKVHKGDRGNQEYRYLIVISSGAWLDHILKINFESCVTCIEPQLNW